MTFKRYVINKHNLGNSPPNTAFPSPPTIYSQGSVSTKDEYVRTFEDLNFTPPLYFVGLVT